jgi:hypothetical protein
VVAVRCYIDDIVEDRAVIAVSRIGDRITDVWVFDDPVSELSYKPKEETMNFATGAGNGCNGCFDPGEHSPPANLAPGGGLWYDPVVTGAARYADGAHLRRAEAGMRFSLFALVGCGVKRDP